MRRRLFSFLFLGLSTCSWADIEYSIEPEPAAKTLRVSMRLDAGEKQELRIPAWCPGFYFLQKYQEKISDVIATDEAGQRLAISRPDARAWLVSNPTKSAIRVTYRVLGDDGGLGFFNVSIRPNTAFVNGPAAFLYPSGRLEEAIKLKVKMPAGWDVATAMDPGGEANTFKAAGYDEFVDHPLQMGKFERRKFQASGTNFEAIYVSLNGKYAPDLDFETRRLEKIVRPAIALFNGAPFKRYLFIVHLDPGNFDGGLEHRACNVVNTANAEPLMIDSLFAHEYFHAWNVKQIRPKVLGPFDYTKPVRTGNLWFSEGVTDYYAYLTTYQSGLQGEDWMIENFAFQIASIENSEVAKKKTLEEVSKGTWETGGFGDGDLSYYEKGMIVGLLFDAKIRSVTNGEKSLDDVMRYLYAQHRLPKAGFEEDGILKAINLIAGTDLSTLYRQMLQTPSRLPYDLLKEIGLRVLMPSVPVKTFGVSIRDGVVFDMSNAMLEKGLRPKDVVTHINGVEIEKFVFSNLSVGDSVTLKVSRDDKELEFRTSVSLETPRGYRLERDPLATASAQALLKGWLKRD